MNEEKADKRILECSLKFILAEEGGETLAEGRGEAVLSLENLAVMPKYGEALLFPLRSIEEIREGDYRIELFLSSREKLCLYHLGYVFEDFCRILFRLRNELIVQDLLMGEGVRQAGLEAHCELFAEDGNQLFAGKGEPRLYETALVVLPEGGEPLRVPYSSIEQVREEDYTLTLISEYGEKLVFTRMGKDFEPFTDGLSEVMNQLSLKVQAALAELLPQADPALLRKAARLMREGKAASRRDLEGLSPDLWSGLEGKLEKVGINEEYHFLSSMAQGDRMCIGFKRGLLGDLTGEYIWFLIPIYNLDSNRPGNAIAMEASSGEGGGRATYFFRITGREDYLRFNNIEELHAAVEELINRINRCMLAINFRREPIYLPKHRLEEPRYHKYRLAISKIPALQELRRLFIGRVFHRSQEQWEKDVMDLLKFNASATDDSVWQRGGAHLEEESQP